jgi:hypothetical protein
MKQEWPSWRYGPNGEARIFQQGETIPPGWEDHPRKVTHGQRVQKLGVDANLNGIETVAEIRKAYDAGRITLEQVEEAESTRENPRATILALIQTEREKMYRRERAEALETLRAADVEIADDATDDEINTALETLDDLSEG